ncbi:DUF6323 family protein [Anaerocolumna sp. AGMB13025]|uniref:DUF6323 family protein n=1 Tax=Anaerocolumna sp. AGMB13025 TaxID=3039116 RepID=UPI0024202711|nr:DUF6323 family protein [Anaerocolumna sp. AGMB13025]WFR58680.1 DUF6323 family protein [Anaerocolumna sp. AGMB13025]
MDHDLFNLSTVMIKEQADEIRKCNEYTSKFGVTLTEEEIRGLLINRKEALKSSGRIELSGGILKKLILEFCDSTFIEQEVYAQTLEVLQEMFYYFKNEALDEVSDDELIHIMKEYFDTECQGSLEYLQETTLEEICRNIRYGYGAVRELDDEDED